MSRSYSAFLDRADVPPRRALQQAVDALAAKLVVDDAYVPFETSGYVPCILDGEDAGFDLRFHEGAGGNAPGKNLAMIFGWGGDPREEAAVLIVCAALAKSFGAVVRGPEGDRLFDAAELAGMVRKAMADL